MFTELFMQRALATALLLAPICALLGVFVTARRMAFFSDTISHGALAGIALAFWWGMADPTLPMIGFSLVVAAAILWLKEKTELLTDTIMALLLSGSVSFGIILFSMMKSYRGQIQRFLFGDILAVSPQEVGWAALLFGVVLVGLWLRLNALVLITAQEELAHVCGVRVRLLNYLFVLVLTVTVAMSIRLMGIILVTSLLVIPAATARNISFNLRQHLIGSVLFGVTSGLAGTLLSYQLDVPCGPAIVLTAIAFFLMTLGLSRLWLHRRSRSEAPSYSNPA
jgi:ABC-type Mn2+/Zn2+ transport system permease subunit